MKLEYFIESRISTWGTHSQNYKSRGPELSDQRFIKVKTVSLVMAVSERGDAVVLLCCFV